MALDLGTLRAYLDVDTSKWDSALGEAENKAGKFGGGASKWMGVASAAVIAGGLAAAGALYSLGAKWDDVEDTIRIGTGATGDALGSLVDVAKEVAKNVPADISTIGPAVADLNTRLGLTGTNLETVAGQVLNVSRMLGEDVDINSVTGAFNAFGVEGDDVASKMDYLWQVSQATGIGFNDLSSKLASAAPITQQLGFSFEETAGMIATMDKAGMDSQTMIGAMQKGLASMTTPGEDASDTFQRVVDDIQSFIDTGDDAAARDLAASLFGTRGAAQFVGALANGAINMTDLANVAGITSDTISDASADTADFAEKWQLVQNKASAALEPLASQVFNALGDALEAMMPALESFTNWLSENPAMLQIIAAVIGVLALAFVGLTIATWAMNTALLVNPITWVVLGVVALIAAIILLIMNWDAVMKFLGDAWNGFVGWFTGVLEGFGGWWNDVWNGFIGFLTDAWSGLVGFITDVWQGFVNWLMNILDRMSLVWSIIWGNIASFFTDVWNGIVSFFTSIWENIVSFLAGVLSGIVSTWNSAWGGIASFFTDLWDGLSRGVQQTWGGIMKFFQSIPSTILGFFSGVGSWLFNVGRDLIQGLLNGIGGLASTIGSFFLNLLPSWIVAPFKAALGIASPSKLFKQYGKNTIQGYLAGVDAMQPDLDSRMGDLVKTPEMAVISAGSSSAISAAASSSSRTVNYFAAEGQSLSSEEALFSALGSPRVKGDNE